MSSPLVEANLSLGPLDGDAQLILVVVALAIRLQQALVRFQEPIPDRVDQFHRTQQPSMNLHCR